MLQTKKLVIAAVLSVGTALGAIALPSGWTLYIPGTANPANPKADIESAGFVTMPNFASHFSFVNNTANGKKALKLDTTDGKNDVIMLPLSGTEKRLTVIFKARGSLVPDSATTPYGIFWSQWQRGAFQAVLRHNASNQIKGSSGQTALKPDDIVSAWGDFRLVFEVADDGKTMTATAFVNGKQRHQTKSFVKDIPAEATATFNTDTFVGLGNYLLFGEADGGTNGFARYAYFLVIRDDDVSAKSLEELSAAAGFDLAQTPVTENDPNPASKKPAKKPEGINMTGAEASAKDPVAYVDPASVTGNKIDFDSLPYSKAKVQKVNRAPVLPKFTPDAVVDASGATAGSFRTVAEAIAAVTPGGKILVKAGLYNGKLSITKPVSLIGENPATTVIYGYEADTGGIAGNILVDVNYTGVADKAYFNAENITFYNKGPQWNQSWGSSERRGVTFAITAVDQSYIKNCVFLGQQDTLYPHTGRAYFQNCYIEGEVDFICGGATVLFDNCHIHSIPYANGGYVNAAAPGDTNGKGFENGYVYRSCLFTADASFAAQTKKNWLGRGAWTGGSNGGPNPAKVVIINSVLENHIDKDGWSDWDNVNTVEKAFFREFNNTGTFAIAADTGKRKLLTQAEYAATYDTTEKILGYTPTLKY